jgi:uncharacterized membrane protein YhiD involved in acid resistance
MGGSDHSARLALAAAYALALPIGWNRETAERSAGLLTFPLVALASCGFVQAMVVNSPEAMVRIIEGLITGVGFIGAGPSLSTALSSVAPNRSQPVGKGRHWRCGRARQLMFPA